MQRANLCQVQVGAGRFFLVNTGYCEADVDEYKVPGDNFGVNARFTIRRTPQKSTLALRKAGSAPSILRTLPGTARHMTSLAAKRIHLTVRGVQSHMYRVFSRNCTGCFRALPRSLAASPRLQIGSHQHKWLDFRPPKFASSDRRVTRRPEGGLRPLSTIRWSWCGRLQVSFRRSSALANYGSTRVTLPPFTQSNLQFKFSLRLRMKAVIACA